MKKTIKIRHWAILAFCLHCVVVELALAGSDDYGGGWAVPSLDTSQSIIRDIHDREMMDRKILGEHSSEEDSSNSSKIKLNNTAPSKAALAKLNYGPSMQVRKRNYAQFVEKTRANNPAGADNLAALLASTDVVASMDSALKPYGLRTNNLADAYSVYWVTAWEAANGIKQNSSKAQALAVSKQAASALLAVKTLQTATDAVKQEFAESLLVQAAMIEAAAEQAKANPTQMQQVAAAVKQGARSVGLNLDAVKLTEAGFVPIEH